MQVLPVLRNFQNYIDASKKWKIRAASSTIHFMRQKNFDKKLDRWYDEEK